MLLLLRSGGIAVLALWTTALHAVAVAPANAGSAPLPHIFLLYVDDWGWANVGFHREVPSPEVATPNIDAIVQDGVQLNRMYAFPYCAPSRAALMSGRMPRDSNHANIRGATYDYNHTEVGGQGVPRNQTTLSQMLAHAGYWSAFAGKWDVGFATQGHIPAGRGYASSLAYFFQINE
jgi:arylsulfatase B